MNNEYMELKTELKEVVKEMREGHKTQMEILTELRVVKPQVDQLKEDLKEAKHRYDQELDRLKQFMWKAVGILTAANAVGWPAVIFMLTHAGK